MLLKIKNTANRANAVANDSTEEAMPQAQLWLRRLGAIGFGLLAALIIVEIGFRILHRHQAPSPKFRDRPHYFYLPEYASNRDRLYSASKEPNTFRVIVIGDSFSEAGENQFDDVFPKRLERMLNLNNAHRVVEVLNWGTPGFSTAHEVNLVRRAIGEFSPDLIILQITLNDPEVVPYRVKNKNVVEDGSFNALLANWTSLTFLRARLDNLRSRRDYIEYYSNLFENKESWGLFSSSMERIAEATRTAKIPLLAVTFPLFSHPIDESYPFGQQHKKISELLSALQVQSVDLQAAYRDIPVDRLQVRPGVDSHPNEIAHRIAADRIYRALESSNLIPADIKIKRYDQHRNARVRKD